MKNTILWVKRIGLGILGLVGLIALLLIGSVVFDANFGNESSEFTNVEYTDADGNQLLGYLARPEGPGPHPGVLLIHEWWGLNEGIPVLAEALAQQGYVVFAPDAYRGEVTGLFTRALWLRLTLSDEQVRGDLDAALNYLSEQEAVDSERLATMGFCWGGGESLQLGLRSSENLALTIMYYGAVVTDPDLLRPLTDGQPVLGIFAEDDQIVFAEDVIEFEAALNSLNIPNQITIYPDVGHAFVTHENYNEPGPAMQAWQETLQFLDANLKSG